MARISTFITALAAVIPRCHCFGVTASNNALVLANAIFTGPGVVVQSATFTGSSASSGTFTGGLGGIGNGAILTTGNAVGALPNGDHYVNNGAAGSDTYCGTNTFNAAILSVSVAIANGYNGVEVEFIMASEEEGGSPDPIGIFLGGQQYAIGYNGAKITAQSPYFSQPIVITPPDSVSSYPGSTPPLLVGIPATGTKQMVFAICDFSDTEWDSALIYVNLYIDDFIELGEFCKFDDSAVHEQYFNRLFHHVHNIFNDDIVKHTRVINYVNGTHHLHYSHIADFPSKYSGVVQRFFDDVGRVVDAQNLQHGYFHVFPLYEFILKRSFNTRADAIIINHDQFCKQCPFHAHIDISSRHKRRYNPVFNWCASELGQCPYITNQLASQLFFISSESGLIDLQQCPKYPPKQSPNRPIKRPCH
ncbi:hypothetical protein CGCF413_v013823 [Colletotrichum fructicola]|nr:hypothetical protein CGCF413_v013823 [Colletotrichum fructicola]